MLQERERESGGSGHGKEGKANKKNYAHIDWALVTACLNKCT